MSPSNHGTRTSHSSCTSWARIMVAITLAVAMTVQATGGITRGQETAAPFDRLTIAQQLVDVPAPSVAWRVSGATAEPLADANPVARDAGFTIASEDSLLVLNDETGQRSLLETGEASVNAGNVTETIGSTTGETLPYFRIDLVAADDVEAAGDATLIAASDAFAPTEIPAASKDQALGYDLTLRGGTLVNGTTSDLFSGERPVMLLVLSGELDIAGVPAVAGDAIEIVADANVTLTAIADTRYVVSVLGEPVFADTGDTAPDNSGDGIDLGSGTPEPAEDGATDDDASSDDAATNGDADEDSDSDTEGDTGGETSGDTVAITVTAFLCPDQAWWLTDASSCTAATGTDWDVTLLDYIPENPEITRADAEVSDDDSTATFAAPIPETDFYEVVAIAPQGYGHVEFVRADGERVQVLDLTDTNVAAGMNLYFYPYGEQVGLGGSVALAGRYCPEAGNVSTCQELPTLNDPGAVLFDAAGNIVPQNIQPVRATPRTAWSGLPIGTYTLDLSGTTAPEDGTFVDAEGSVSVGDGVSFGVDVIDGSVSLVTLQYDGAVAPPEPTIPPVVEPTTEPEADPTAAPDDSVGAPAEPSTPGTTEGDTPVTSDPTAEPDTTADEPTEDDTEG